MLRKEENTDLKAELSEIKGFLKDFGLRWKGSRSNVEGELNIQKLDAHLNIQKPKYNFNLPKEVEIGLIAQRISELNFQLAKEGRNSDVKKGKDGIHRFEHAKPKLIIFYKNGIQLEGFPLFVYGSHDAVSLLADILDGYFPRQLEKSSPDGVLLKLVDRLDEMSDFKPSKPLFSRRPRRQ